VPQGQSDVAGQSIRLGGGSADVRATHNGNSYVTEINTSSGVGAHVVMIGHTLPRSAHPASVVLDGQAVSGYQMRLTNRGLEVTVATTAGHHTLTITA
jgi:hypothetical protein